MQKWMRAPNTGQKKNQELWQENAAIEVSKKHRKLRNSSSHQALPKNKISLFSCTLRVLNAYSMLRH